MSEKFVILNVGLWVGGVRPPSGLLEERIAAVSAFCVSQFGGANSDVVFECHRATDDGSREDTLVVAFEAGVGWRWDVFDLAVLLQQDCIACWIVTPHTDPRGILIGPHVGPWEPFKHSEFIFPRSYYEQKR